jgi:hypothetical protein
VAGVLSLASGLLLAVLVSAARPGECCSKTGPPDNGLFITFALITALLAFAELMTLWGSPRAAVAGELLVAAALFVLLMLAVTDPNTDVGGVLFWFVPLPLLVIAAWRAVVAHRRETA